MTHTYKNKVVVVPNYYKENSKIASKNHGYIQSRNEKREKQGFSYNHHYST